MGCFSYLLILKLFSENPPSSLPFTPTAKPVCLVFKNKKNKFWYFTSLHYQIRHSSLVIKVSNSRWHCRIIHAICQKVKLVCTFYCRSLSAVFDKNSSKTTGAAKNAYMAHWIVYISQYITIIFIPPLY